MTLTTNDDSGHCQSPGRIALALFLMLFCSVAYAGRTINTDWWSGVAIGGYDPVAYFTMNRATEGSEKFTYEFLDSEWHFANAEHRDLFVKSPLEYVPQYGGYCAAAVTQDSSTRTVDPRVWRIVDGKLYLFFSERSGNDWTYDDPAVANADGAWDRVKAGLE